MGYGLKGIELPQDNPELVRRLCYRWMRALDKHNDWAKTAKRCVEFLEGEQWTPEEKAILRQMRRTSLTLNEIAPLYRLVIGYQSSNRLDVSFLPTSDSVASEDIAAVLNNVHKSESNRCDLKFTDTDVFADGISTGRGYWDYQLCFKENDLGELKVEAKDPFSIFVDPDADTYELGNSASTIQESVWTNIDSINERFGSDAAYAVQNLMSPNHNSNILSYFGDMEVSPKRFFGQVADDKDYGSWSDFYYQDFVDKQAKQIRLLSSQYKIESIVPCFVDLETGDKQAVPQEWLRNPQILEKILDYAQKIGNPVRIMNRPMKRVRHTTTCGDILLHDKWSMYEDYSIIGFFPYFRRGKTRGMIEDLIDPQREKNKKRSVMTDILNRNANSGWMYEENTLDTEQEENLRQFGATPGINIKYKRKEGSEKPQRIEPGTYPQGLDRLEEKASNDLHQISGINQSALGQLDTVQSGRAIEARQRQAVLAIQPYSDNFSRSKKIGGRSALSIYQRFYSEERVFRVLGEDSSLVKYEINKKMQVGTNSMTRMNDITVGKYSVHIDEVPISATFKQAQFEETMLLIEKLGPIGMALAQTNPGLIIDQSSLPRKNDWKKALEEAQQQVDPMMQQQAGMASPSATPMQTKTPEMVSG
jgi:hypothetical protein